jgi:hypothetical protein
MARLADVASAQQQVRLRFLRRDEKRVVRNDNAVFLLNFLLFSFLLNFL